ncbi:MAG: argininosuccinate synthase, partial [Aquabacterium sp.]|nr:argininosuccinate synthase [Aquabacterium sp.]
MSKTTKSAQSKAVKAAKATKPVAAPVAAPAPAAAGQKVKKVVLAYSGGLDTSIILKWLQDEYNCEVVTFTADIGQG